MEAYQWYTELLMCNTSSNQLTSEVFYYCCVPATHPTFDLDVLQSRLGLMIGFGIPEL